MYIAIAVTTARRIHLFSSRTQKLSFATPKVLVGQLTGRIGSCRIQLRNNLVHTNEVILFLYVLVAGYKRIMVAASAITGFLSKVFWWRVR